MRARSLMTLAVLLTGSLPSVAADRAVSVTIYSNDLALIQDTRNIEIPAGRQQLEFQDVHLATRSYK